MMVSYTWRNLWRNRRRTLIVMASVCFAVLLSILMRSLQAGVFDHLIRNMVGYHTGYVQVHAKGFWDEQVLDNSMDGQQVLAELGQRIDGMSGAIPRVESFALASSDTLTRGCQVIGTNLAQEAKLMNLDGKLVAGRFPSGSSDGILLAEGLADKLGLNVDDTLVLIGQGYQGSFAAGKFRVIGLLRFASPQMNGVMAFMDLKLAQELFSLDGRITSLVVQLTEPDQLDGVTTQLHQRLRDRYEVMTWKEMMPEIEGHIRADAASLSIWTGILYVIIAFGVFGTLLMMMTERRYELGMLEALGVRKMSLAGGLFAENILIALFGILAGALIALPVVIGLRAHPLRFGGRMAMAYERFGFEPVFPTLVDAGIFFKEASIVFILVLVMGLYPIWTVHRSDPVKSMKR